MRFWLQKVNEFLSTPSARRATVSSRDSPRTSKISIHALREEGDRSTSTFWDAPMYFYPRPPRGGRLPSGAKAQIGGYFYPRPPRGGRQFIGGLVNWPSEISIHALREEGDA